MPAIPKPEPRIKTRKRLQAKTRLQKKSRLKSKSKVPDSFKYGVLERDGYRCQNCGRYAEDTPHHIIFQSHGRNTDWIHDPRNGVTLCALHHIYFIHNGDKASNEWRRYWELWAVRRFGWLGGRDMTVEEYQELSRCRAGVK